MEWTGGGDAVVTFSDKCFFLTASGARTNIYTTRARIERNKKMGSIRAVADFLAL